LGSGGRSLSRALARAREDTPTDSWRRGDRARAAFNELSNARARSARARVANVANARACRQVIRKSRRTARATSVQRVDAADTDLQHAFCPP
jgi:hypothetical protein